MSSGVDRAGTDRVGAAGPDTFSVLVTRGLYFLPLGFVSTTGLSLALTVSLCLLVPPCYITLI